MRWSAHIDARHCREQVREAVELVVGDRVEDVDLETKSVT